MNKKIKSFFSHTSYPISKKFSDSILVISNNFTVLAQFHTGKYIYKPMVINFFRICHYQTHMAQLSQVGPFANHLIITPTCVFNKLFFYSSAQ